MILVRKKFKFFLYMFMVKIRQKTESSAFHRISPEQYLKQCIVFVLYFSK